MGETRRGFLKKAGYAALGLGCGLPLFGAAALGERRARPRTPAKQLGLVIDVRKCMDGRVARAAIEACHSEHNVPFISDPLEEVKWVWTEPFERAFPDQAHGRAPEFLRENPVLVLCNHCSDPPCVRVCPTKATWKRRSDGVVMMDMHRCIGCRYCMAACPYGARSFNWRDPRAHLTDVRAEYPTRTAGVVEKCTFCDERLREGREPACVEAVRCVPGADGAMTFGDVSDPESEASRLLRAKFTICRRVELGTGPNVFYIV
ncbi:MAG: sulfate reduction electron transfer complex DsrMKJOP subunit DsrO [bacterium]